MQLVNKAVVSHICATNRTMFERSEPYWLPRGSKLIQNEQKIYISLHACIYTDEITAWQQQQLHPLAFCSLQMHYFAFLPIY
jgi:hypothetical protein